MSPKENRLVECKACYTLIAYLNGVCPECGGTGIVEEKDPPEPLLPPEKPEPKTALKSV